MLALLVVTGVLGLDAILGAFMAGALLSVLTDDERDADFGHFRHKLEGIGFAFFIPVFFVSTGIAFPVEELFSDASTILRIPRLPRPAARRARRAGAAPPQGRLPDPGRRLALMQSTSLSFIVVATTLGVSIGEVRPSTRRHSSPRGCSPCCSSPHALALLRREERRDGTRSRDRTTPGPEGGLP